MLVFHSLSFNILYFVSTLAGYAYNDTEEFSEDNVVLEKKHTFALFAYQFEFFTISIFFLGAFFSFMYAGTQPSDDSWRLYILSWVAFIFSAINVFVCGIDRNKFMIRDSSALLRMVVFIIDALLLIFCYPIGTGPGALCLIAALIEYRVFKLKCNQLPAQITGILILAEKYNANESAMKLNKNCVFSVFQFLIKSIFICIIFCSA